MTLVNKYCLVTGRACLAQGLIREDLLGGSGARELDDWFRLQSPQLGVVNATRNQGGVPRHAHWLLCDIIFINL